MSQQYELKYEPYYDSLIQGFRVYYRKAESQDDWERLYPAFPSFSGLFYNKKSAKKALKDLVERELLKQEPISYETIKI